jgi:hypothetical protein
VANARVDSICSFMEGVRCKRVNKAVQSKRKLAIDVTFTTDPYALLYVGECTTAVNKIRMPSTYTE